MVCASVCDVSGATSPSCTVIRVIRNVHDQLESILYATCCSKSTYISPSRIQDHSAAVEFLTPGTSDVIPAVSSPPEIFGHFQVSV